MKQKKVLHSQIFYYFHNWLRYQRLLIQDRINKNVGHLKIRIWGNFNFAESGIPQVILTEWWWIKTRLLFNFLPLFKILFLIINSIKYHLKIISSWTFLPIMRLKRFRRVSWFPILYFALFLSFLWFIKGNIERVNILDEDFPTESPTAVFYIPTPTLYPTDQDPALTPTASPTFQPTRRPTIIPSCRPSGLPTIRPSPRPSIFPTPTPSLYSHVGPFNKSNGFIYFCSHFFSI